MTRIIVFAKAPAPGLSKTRLVPALGWSGAAQLAQRMLRHTLSCAIEAQTGAVELCATPDIAAPAWSGVGIPQGIEISAQCAGDLGARLADAAQRGLAHDAPVLLIGTDCAEMSAALLRSAAVALEHKDAVVYPATDGGYVLLGLGRFHPALFENIAWSTGSVAAETIGRIGQLGWSLEIGAPLRDIDGPEDLKHVPPGWL